MKALYLTMSLCLLAACTSVPGVSDWKPEPIPVAGPRQDVPAYEVEVLPEVPTVPGTVMVGSFRILNRAGLQYDNEEFMQAIKEMAADMGGNTIIYSGEGATTARVAYVPLEEVNYHGGDEALIEAGVLSEEH